MKATLRIIIVNGQMSVFVEDGTFEEGKQAIAGLMAALGAQATDTTTKKCKRTFTRKGDSMAKAQNKVQVEKPTWYKMIEDKFAADVSHTFIAHGNVRDYVDKAVDLQTFIAGAMAKREVTVFYDISRGLSFPFESHEQMFRALVMPSVAQSQAANPALEALNSLRAGGGQAQKADYGKSPKEVLPLLEKLLKATRTDADGATSDVACAVVIEYGEMVAPDAPLAAMSPDDRQVLVTLLRWGQEVSGNRIVFMTANSLSNVHAGLREASARWEAVQVPMPNTEQRLAFIQWYLDKHPLKSDIAPQVLVNMTAGLNRKQIEDILLRATSNGRLTADLVRERKEGIIKQEYGEVLEIAEPRTGFADIYGHEYVKRYFQESVIDPVRSGEAGLLGFVPMGILLAGPAGTGKTVLAQAVAKEAGFNCVYLRMSKIVSKWQGEGERNMDRVLTALDAMLPVIVIIDEIDQAFKRGEGGESMQDQRIFQRALEFFSDTAHRGEVILLGMTNRPDLMDPALLRPGRIDDILPVLCPDTAEEREKLFAGMAGRFGLAVQSVSGECIDTSDGWSQAEIEGAVRKALKAVRLRKIAPEDALRQAVASTVPNKAARDFMTLLAVQECSDIEHLPPSYRDLRRNQSQLAAQVKETRSQFDQGSERGTQREL
jgi:transitional endoplasmic reticulum ATPase